MKRNHRGLLFVLILCLLIVVSCGSKSQWADNPQYLLTEEEINAEIAIKMEQVNKFIDEEGLKGILLTQVRNVYWMTAGLTNNQIVLNKDVGSASLLIMRNGEKYVICNGSEAGRLMDESLEDLGYELIMYNWYESNPLKDVRSKIIYELADGGRIGSDIEYPGTVLKSDQFAKLRYSLTDTEIIRYKWLGRETTEAVAEVCRTLKPGMDEFEIEYMTVNALRARGIFPTVLLIAVDERIYNYRHALAGGAKLKNYAMVNVVAEKWGMPIAVTRFVHFGPLPEELAKKLQATAIVNAHYEAATVPGKPLAEIFEECKTWYAKVGFEDEWQKHHQGGATGYNDREYCIYPGIEGTVQENQAFAWNPTITGAKIEDTIISYKDGFEVVTVSKDWPMISITINDKIYQQPDILIR
ncbi:MAG: M24 family metallopeptidase [Candidatus Marinimicrobia bacterium]|nr:M24 family metallopeptidase [Candidatus Neomarinimicrobiota bacterium]